MTTATNAQARGVYFFTHSAIEFVFTAKGRKNETQRKLPTAFPTHPLCKGSRQTELQRFRHLLAAVGLGNTHARSYPPSLLITDRNGADELLTAFLELAKATQERYKAGSRCR
jgi:hypothetical protein